MTELKVGDEVSLVQDEFNIILYSSHPSDPFVVHIENAQKEKFVVPCNLIRSKEFRESCRLFSNSFWIVSIRAGEAWIAYERGKEAHFVVDLKLLVLPKSEEEATLDKKSQIHVGDIVKTRDGKFGKMVSIQYFVRFGPNDVCLLAAEQFIVSSKEEQMEHEASMRAQIDAFEQDMAEKMAQINELVKENKANMKKRDDLLAKLEHLKLLVSGK